MAPRCTLVLLVMLSFFLGCVGVAISGPYTFSFSADSSPASTGPFGENDSGDIAGFFSDATGFHGYLLEADGAFTQLDAPGATSTQAFGINNYVEVVGTFLDPGGAHGFLWDSGVFTTLDVPTATSTVAFGINDSGLIVGAFNDLNLARTRGFQRNLDGSFVAFDAPDATFTQALGITNSGIITGVSDSPFGIAFTMTPIPEPGTLLLLGSGLLGLALRRHLW